MTRKSFNRLKKEGYVSEVKVEPKTIATLTNDYFQLVAKLGEKAYHLTKVSQDKDNQLKTITEEINALQVQIDELQVEGTKLRAEEAEKAKKEVSEAVISPQVSNVVSMHVNVSDSHQVGNAG